MVGSPYHRTYVAVAIWGDCGSSNLGLVKASARIPDCLR
jgi:hypothetical protein